MSVSVTFGQPYEMLAVIQEPQIVMHVYPTFVGFAHYVRGTTCFGISEEYIELGLWPIQRLHRELLAVWQPFDAGYVFIRIRAKIDPGRFGIIQLHHACTDTRVCRTRFRVSLANKPGQVRFEIDVMHFTDAGFVRLQVGDRPGIRRPEISLVDAAKQLLPVDP